MRTARHPTRLHCRTNNGCQASFPRRSQTPHSSSRVVTSGSSTTRPCIATLRRRSRTSSISARLVSRRTSSNSEPIATSFRVRSPIPTATASPIVSGSSRRRQLIAVSARSSACRSLTTVASSTQTSRRSSVSTTRSAPRPRISRLSQALLISPTSVAQALRASASSMVF